MPGEEFVAGWLRPGPRAAEQPRAGTDRGCHRRVAKWRMKIEPLWFKKRRDGRKIGKSSIGRNCLARLRLAPPIKNSRHGCKRTGRLDFLAAVRRAGDPTSNRCRISGLLVASIVPMTGASARCWLKEKEEAPLYEKNSVYLLTAI